MKNSFRNLKIFGGVRRKLGGAGSSTLDHF